VVKKSKDKIFKNSYKILFCSLLLGLIICIIENYKLFSQSTLGKKPNIILIAPDALRAKQLPCYGYNKIRTETIDNLVKNSVIFNYCFVKLPGTITSFSNLFSGSWSVSDGLKNNEKTLAQYLKENGYFTVGFVSSQILWSSNYHKRNEFNRGFDEWYQDVSLEKLPVRHRKNEDTTADIINWLNKHKDINSPFFLFAHYMDPHAPYEPSYDSEIEKIDKELSKIIKKLKELSIYDNSLIIFTSDHGESLGEHNSPLGHGWFLYTEQIQVPLIIKFPKNKYIRSINQLVRNIDILPTILDYIGSKYDEDKIDGKSLLPAIERNKNLGLISYHETNSSRVCPEGSEGIIFSEKNLFYQYIQGKFSERYHEFYNITLDSDTKNNLYYNSKYKKLTTKAKKHLSRMGKQLQEREKSVFSKYSSQIDEKQSKMLKSLGYIRDGAPTPYIRKGLFLIMSKHLNKIGVLKYSDFIRKSGWGKSFKDNYYPLKIITLDNKKYFIIANKDRELFQFSKKEGFKSLNIKNVKDIALYPLNKTLFIVQKNPTRLKIMQLQGIVRNYRHPKTNYILPCESIYIDQSSNIYILKKRGIIKLNKKRKIEANYKIPGWKYNLTAVDKEGNIFLGRNNKVFKFDKKGTFIQSFGEEEIHYGISSIAIDKENRIWVLEEKSPSVIIFNRNGEKITSFIYNTYEPSNKLGTQKRFLKPIQLFICQNRIYIIDEWEGILVYQLSKK